MTCVVVDRAERIEREREVGMIGTELGFGQLDRPFARCPCLGVLARAVEDRGELAELIGERRGFGLLRERDRVSKVRQRLVVLPLLGEHGADRIVPVDHQIVRIACALDRGPRDAAERGALRKALRERAGRVRELDRDVGRERVVLRGRGERRGFVERALGARGIVRRHLELAVDVQQIREHRREGERACLRQHRVDGDLCTVTLAGLRERLRACEARHHRVDLCPRREVCGQRRLADQRLAIATRS